VHRRELPLPVDRQAAFAGKERLDFRLLSDADRGIAKAFGANRPGPVFNRRPTFVIDTDRTVLAVIASETNKHTHADTALTILRARPG
jgi:peroxiredoxin Q/BCP